MPHWVCHLLGGRVAEPPLLVNRQRTVRGDWDQVRRFLGMLQSHLEQSGFSVCLVSDRAICRYNRQYRQRNEPTDVLSFATGGRTGIPACRMDDSTHLSAFPAEVPPANGRAYLGDIVISAQTAQRNARRYGLRLEQEVEILVLHGILHLMGYDHESDPSTSLRAVSLSNRGGRMTRLEKRWREQLGLPTSLTERASETRSERLSRQGLKPKRRKAVKTACKINLADHPGLKAGAREKVYRRERAARGRKLVL